MLVLRVHAQSRIAEESQPNPTQTKPNQTKPNQTKPPLLLSTTLFLVRMRFSSVPKARFARGARNGCSLTNPGFTAAVRTVVA
jgi:hypothetical protein